MGGSPSADIAFSALVTFFAFLGLLISGYSSYHLRLPLHNSCPLWLRGICSELVHTPYYRLIGIPNLWLACGYFFLLTFAPYPVILAQTRVAYLAAAVLVVSLLGALFALYAQWLLIFLLRVECGICIFLTLLSLLQVIFWSEKILRSS